MYILTFVIVLYLGIFYDIPFVKSVMLYSILVDQVYLVSHHMYGCDVTKGCVYVSDEVILKFSDFF